MADQNINVFSYNVTRWYENLRTQALPYPSHNTTIKFGQTQRLSLKHSTGHSSTAWTPSRSPRIPVYPSVRHDTPFFLRKHFCRTALRWSDLKSLEKCTLVCRLQRRPNEVAQWVSSAFQSADERRSCNRSFLFISWMCTLVLGGEEFPP